MSRSSHWIGLLTVAVRWFRNLECVQNHYCMITVQVLKFFPKAPCLSRLILGEFYIFTIDVNDFACIHPQIGFCPVGKLKLSCILIAHGNLFLYESLYLHCDQNLV